MAKGSRDPAYKYQRGFAKRLEAARIAAGYKTVKAMADELGVHQETYRLWERGERQPPFHVLVKISQKVDRSLDFLIQGHNET